jgi:hypothetical protein
VNHALGGVYSDPVDRILIAAQHIAKQANDEVAAINHSYVLSGGAAHGNGQPTLGLDWIALRYNVLNVTGVPNVELPLPPFSPQPFDDFNGFTVARADKVGDTFRQVSDRNVFLDAFQQNRTLMDLIAPGEDSELIQFEAEPDNLQLTDRERRNHRRVEAAFGSRLKS